MALDGLAVRALACEFKEKLLNLKIDKIYQPVKDELLLSLRGFSGEHKLLLCANPSLARAAFVTETKENPATAPMFCMLLRKNIASGVITDVYQPDFERIIMFEIEAHNDFGELTKKTIAAEIMGRNSNIILLDENKKIIDSIKRIDFSISSKRQILPGLIYELPPSQEKANPLLCKTEEFINILKNADSEELLSSFLIKSFSGISPIIAREIAYRTFNDTDARIDGSDFSSVLSVAAELNKLFDRVRQGNFSPCYLKNCDTGKLMEFSAVEINQYGKLAEVFFVPSMAFLTDDFYKERDRKLNSERRGANLLKLVKNNIDRCAKKAILLKKEIDDTEKKAKWQQYGDLVTVNLYKIKHGDPFVSVENYFDNMEMINIPLDITISPSKNAQAYYKKYAKAKTAFHELSKQLELNMSELLYLESVHESIVQNESSADLLQIADELAETGYIKRAKDKKQNKKPAPLQPSRFCSDDGYTILAGRNNKQNDILTFKLSSKSDLWFHTKNIHGSHVLLKKEDKEFFSDNAINQAANIAAYFSKARGGTKIDVDFTEVKNVKKPSGSKPGFVIYTENKTVSADATEETFNKISKI